MTPHKQLNPHRPPESYGDCVRTCLACLLDKHPSQVPNFFHGDNAEKAWHDLESYLKSIGLAPILLGFSFDGMELQSLLDIIGGANPDVYYLLFGNTRDDIGHCVICHGNDIAFDPHWLDCGVHKPDRDGNYTFMFLTHKMFCG